MKKIIGLFAFALLMAYSCINGAAQTPDLKQENATLKQQLAALRVDLAKAHQQLAIYEGDAAVKELEAAYPGTHWDKQRQTLVSDPPQTASLDTKKAVDKK